MRSAHRETTCQNDLRFDRRSRSQDAQHDDPQSSLSRSGRDRLDCRYRRRSDRIYSSGYRAVLGFTDSHRLWQHRDRSRQSIDPCAGHAELLCGIPIAASDITRELTTPTGAAIIKATCRSFGSMPAMTMQAVGYGSGTYDLPNQANLLRIVLGEIKRVT